MWSSPPHTWQMHDVGLRRLDEELLAEHGIRPIRDALHERVELDAVGVHNMLDVG